MDAKEAFKVTLNHNVVQKSERVKGEISAEKVTQAQADRRHWPSDFIAMQKGKISWREVIGFIEKGLQHESHVITVQQCLVIPPPPASDRT